MALRRAFAPFLAGLVLAGCSKAPRGQMVLAPAVTEDVSQSGDSPTLRPTPRPAAGARPTSRGAELDAASVAVLKQAIDSKDYATRLIAIEAIADARAEALLPWLEHVLGDPEHDVRMAAVEALERIGSSRALSILTTVRDDTTEELDVRALAASALLDVRGASPLAEPSSSSLLRRDSAPVQQTHSDRR